MVLNRKALQDSDSLESVVHSEGHHTSPQEQGGPVQG